MWERNIDRRRAAPRPIDCTTVGSVLGRRGHLREVYDRRMPQVDVEIDHCTWPECQCGGKPLTWETRSGLQMWRDKTGRLRRTSGEAIWMAVCPAGTPYWRVPAR